MGRIQSGDLRRDGLDDGKGVGPDTLVLIDEAGWPPPGTSPPWSGTSSRPVAVRLVGDDQQLSAVAAGGIFRDHTGDTGTASPPPVASPRVR